MSASRGRHPLRALARPASCISAAPAPPCSTGSTRATTAAASCSGSRIPTRRARPRRRSTRSSTGCSWLGLDWDGETHFQSEYARPPRRGRARAAGERPCLSLLDEPGGAGRRSARRRRPSASRSARAARGATATDGPGRALRGPPEGAAGGRDGRSTTRSRAASPSRMSELDDFVLLRSDGSPTYMLAVVVDDHDMGVTHVIRGDDHLNNAFRQLAIIRAMGWPEPVYGHVPLIHGADGAKLSKRHGALGVEAYRDELGILPEALFNYLLRLGWGHGDDEIISREEAVSVVRPRRCRQVAVALRPQEARKSQRPLSARGRSRAARRAGRAEDRGRRCRPARPRDAVADAAGEGSERAGGRRRLPVQIGAARHGRESGRAARGRRAGPARPRPPVFGRTRRLDGRGERAGGAGGG